MTTINNCLLTTVLFFTYHCVFACSCIDFYNYCDSYEGPSQTVSLGVVDTLYMVDYNQVMYFDIIDEIKGSLDSSTVSIFSNGGICGEDLYRFNVGDTVVLRLIPDFNDLEYATHFLSGQCNTNFIPYSNGILEMQNDSRLGRVSYNDFKTSEGDCSQLTNTEEPSIENEIVFWPNPTVDRLFLDGQYDRYQILSIDGRIVASGDMDFNSAIEVDFLTEGVYTIILYTEDKKRAARFAKL